MIPVEQTKFSIFYADDSRLTYGNCLVACIASIMEVGILEVPNIYVYYGMGDFGGAPVWMGVLNLWSKFNYGRILVKTKDFSDLPDSEYYIKRGLSYRGRLHCVVGHNSLGDWDPYPTHEGLKEVHHYYYFRDVDVLDDIEHKRIFG